MPLRMLHARGVAACRPLQLVFVGCVGLHGMTNRAAMGVQVKGMADRCANDPPSASC